MDEPFGAVDPVGRRRLQTEFARIQRTLGITVMLVTHDIDEAVRMADRVAVLSPGAHIEQLASPLDIVARPATPAVADLVGRGRTARLLALGRLERADLDPGVQDAGRGGPASDRRRRAGRRARPRSSAPTARCRCTTSRAASSAARPRPPSCAPWTA